MSFLFRIFIFYSRFFLLTALPTCEQGLENFSSNSPLRLNAIPSVSFVYLPNICRALWHSGFLDDLNLLRPPCRQGGNHAR
jgi:hypothetical protein